MARSMVLIVVGFLTAISCAQAQSWKRDYPALVYMVQADADEGQARRFQPFLKYLSGAIGVPVRLEIAAKCESTGEEQKKQRVHIAHYCGAAAFARAYLNGAKIEPFAIDANKDGTTGYYSEFFVRKTAPYQRIEDLKGKILGLGYVDSTSSDLEPRFMLHGKGFTPETFFSRVVYTGGPTESILALRDGKIDVAAVTSDIFASFPELDASQFRTILTSELLPLPPVVYLGGLPAELKLTIRGAFLSIGNKDMAAFKARTGLNQSGNPWQLADFQTYQHMVGLMKFVDQVRKK